MSFTTESAFSTLYQTWLIANFRTAINPLKVESKIRKSTKPLAFHKILFEHLKPKHHQDPKKFALHSSVKWTASKVRIGLLILTAAKAILVTAGMAQDGTRGWHPGDVHVQHDLVATGGTQALMRITTCMTCIYIYIYIMCMYMYVYIYTYFV